MVDGTSFHGHTVLAGVGWNATVAATTMRGPENRRVARPNQDAIAAIAGRHFVGVAVADGLGSCARSHEGAAQAVSIALAALAVHLAAESAGDDVALIAAIVEDWERKLPEGERRSYGTTLLFAAVVADRLLLGAIGDGMLQLSLNFEPGRELLGERPGFGNETHALGGVDSARHFRLWHHHLRPGDLPAAVLLATDGVSDDIERPLRPLLTPTLATGLMRDGAEQTARTLEGWLENWKTAGHSDDKSIGIIAIHDRPESA